MALLASLRSPAFACTDVDLLSFVQAGGKLNYLAAAEENTGLVAECFLILSRFHQDWALFPVLVDEFHVYAGHNMDTESVETFLSETRSYLVPLVVSTQYLGRLSRGLSRLCSGTWALRCA